APIVLSPPQSGAGGLQMVIHKVLAPGSPQPGRPTRPVQQEPPLTLVRQATYIRTVSLSDQTGANQGVPKLNLANQPARVIYELRLSRNFYREGFPVVGVLVDGNEAVCS